MGQKMLMQLLKALGATALVLWSVGEFGIPVSVALLYVYIRITGMKTYHDGGLG